MTRAAMDGVKAWARQLGRPLSGTPGPHNAITDLPGHRLEINPDDRPPLPRSLAEALVRLEGTAAARTWLGAELLAGYLAYKRAELAALQSLQESEICRRYAEVY